MTGRPADGVTAHVTHLRTTPIKGFTMQESSTLSLTETGVVGDRAFFMVDRADKLVSATRTAAFLPYWARFDPQSDLLSIGRGDDMLHSEQVNDGGEPVRAHFFADRYATGHVVPGDWGRLLSEIAGRSVRLVRAADPLGGFDLHRVSLASEESVSALDGADDAPIDDRRFRMTVTIQGVAPFTEDTWQGGLVHVGDSVVRVEVPIRRCAAAQKDPDGLESRVDPLLRIRHVRGTTTSRSGRGLHLGVYGEVVQPGLVRVGDAVQPVPA